MTTHHMGVSEGPTCDICGTSEARCARLEIRCCGEYCTHFADDIVTAAYPAEPAPAVTKKVGTSARRATKDRRISKTPGEANLKTGAPVEGPSGPLCAETDPDLFFPDKGGSTRDAKAICRRCTLRADCLEAGLGERFGIWGGLSERERRPIAQARGITYRTTDDSDIAVLVAAISTHSQEVA